MTGRFNRFSPSCNCCGNSCTVFADAFSRSDVGSNWSIQSGTWSIPITEGSLQTASADAEIDQVAGGSASVATATVSSTASGDQLQVGLGSAGTYFAAELEIGTGKLRIVSVAGGTRTVLREADVAASEDANYSISLCSDTYSYVGSTARLYTASFQGTPYHTWGDSVPGGCAAFNAVLATGALTGTASFVDFSLADAHCENSDCPSCGQCCWPPGVATLPDQVQVVISGIGGSSGVNFDDCTDAECDAINGTYVLDETTGCLATYTSHPDNPVCACYELSGLDLTCENISDPITTIRFVAFNISSGGVGPCNLYVDLMLASGYVAFHFDLGLGPTPGGFGAEPCGTYSTTDGFGSATLTANSTSDPHPGTGVHCRHDTLDDGPSATAVVTPI